MKVVINSSITKNGKYQDLEDFMTQVLRLDPDTELEKTVRNNRIIFSSSEDSFPFGIEEKYYSDEISGYSFETYTVTSCDFIPINSKEEILNVLDQNLDREGEYPEYETFTFE